jgi:hypothetical protein
MVWPEVEVPVQRGNPSRSNLHFSLHAGTILNTLDWGNFASKFLQNEII